MQVYGMSMSPFVRKVMVAAAEKGIAYELKPTGLGSTDPVFLAASPFRKMPALVDGDFSLADSTAIVHYFEALHPEPALIPTEARARGKTIWVEEFADTILVAAFAPMFFNRVVAPKFLGRPGDMAAADKAEAEALPPVLAYLETAIGDSGHMVGDTLTLADIAVASPLLNLSHAGYTLDADRFPRIVAFAAAMHARPSFAPIVAIERAMLGQA